MSILSVTIINPGEDSQWWRISSIYNLLKSKYDTEMVHYIIKGSIYYKRLKDPGNLDNEIFITRSVFIPFKILKRIVKKKYSLVYGNTKEGAFFSILARLAGVPLIFDMHGVYEEFYMTNNIRIFNVHRLLLNKLIETLALRFSSKILCVSNEMILHLNKKRGIPLKKMAYITNGVDLDFFKPVKDEKLFEMKKNLDLNGKLVFGYIGRFQEWQGAENLVEAAKSIEQDNIKFLFVGGEETKTEGKIIFISDVSRDEVIYYYSLCDVLVLPRPSHIATKVAAPTKFAEYTSMGKPVLVTDIGDAAKLVKKHENGIIVEDNDPKNLKRGILEFLNLDEQDMVNMGKRSRELAKKEFDWKKISNKLFKIINEVVSSD